MRAFFYLAVSLLFFTSCSPRLTPFTEAMVRENRWTENDLKKIQFYLSEDIVLTRNLGGSASEIVGGEIKMINGRKVEQIIFPKGTAGVALFSPRDNHLAVSFESEGTDRFLMFGPNEKAGGRYVLLAKEWNRRSGRVTYEGQLYRVDGRSAFAALMVDLKRLNKTIYDARRATGRRVGN